MSTYTAARRDMSFSAITQRQEIPATAIDHLIEQLPVGVLVLDRDGRCIYTNEAARALRIEGAEPLQWAVTRALLTEEPVREDEIQIAPLGQPRRWISALITPIRVAGLGINAAFVVVSDVTARTHLNAWAPTIESLVNL